MINRTQLLVLAFVSAAIGFLVLLAVLSPDEYRRTLRWPEGATPELMSLFPLGLGGLAGILAIGVIRRWRWMFWLILVAFLAGGLRMPVTALQLAGVLPSTGASWYELVQAAAGMVQLSIGLLMLRGYRRDGAWGRF